MKLTGIEKKMIAGIVVLSILVFVMVRHIGNEVEKAGGIKGIIVEAGKEIKDIKRQIETAP